MAHLEIVPEATLTHGLDVLDYSIPRERGHGRGRFSFVLMRTNLRPRGWEAPSAS